MELHGGDGWRLRFDPQRHPFVVLIGGEHWAAELTSHETQALQQGVITLLKQLDTLADQLMEEESLSLELERDALWLGLEGYRHGWSLRFVLTADSNLDVPQRAIEGGWSETASQALAAALVGLELPGPRAWAP